MAKPHAYKLPHRHSSPSTTTAPAVQKLAGLSTSVTPFRALALEASSRTATSPHERPTPAARDSPWRARCVSLDHQASPSTLLLLRARPSKGEGRGLHLDRKPCPFLMSAPIQRCLPTPLRLADPCRSRRSLRHAVTISHSPRRPHRPRTCTHLRTPSRTWLQRHIEPPRSCCDPEAFLRIRGRLGTLTHDVCE
jgi:hypothetical protein